MFSKSCWCLLFVWCNTLLRAALEKKKAEEEKEFGAIDYDAPIESDKKTIGFGTTVILGFCYFCFSPENL